MSKFTIIKGNLKNQDLDQTNLFRLSNICYLWNQQFDSTIKRTKSIYGDDILNYPQENLMKIALAGTKFICSIKNLQYERDKLNKDNSVSLEKSRATYSVIELIFMVMGYIKLKNLVRTFPIRKVFDGDRWNTKDYFFTLHELSKFDMDKPIGKESIIDLLWDYENSDIRSLYIEFMMSSSAIYKAETGKGIAERILEDDKFF